MDLFFDCPCGRRTAVAPAQAGSLLACHCGRTNELPGLSELRRQAGKAEYEAGVPHLIRRKVEDGELPGRDCLLCGQPTDELVIARAECEQEFSLPSTRRFAWLFILLGMFVSLWITLIALASREQGPVETRGREVNVTLPLRVCAYCRPHLMAAAGVRWLVRLSWIALAVGVVLLFWRPALGVPTTAAALFTLLVLALLKRFRQRALRDAILREPLYARLLDEYPGAELVLVAAAREVPLSQSAG